jgi:hypothetical protein
MMKTPLVTILTTTYNHSKFIAKRAPRFSDEEGNYAERFTLSVQPQRVDQVFS